VIFTILTYILGQKAGTIADTSLIPLMKRIENAITSLVIYIEKMVWPQEMAIFYPYPKELQVWQLLGGIIVFAGISFIVLRMRKKLPYNFVGWFWYLGTLLPVIGIVQNGSQAYADRYTYVPYIGLFIMISWSIPLVTKNLSYRRTILIAGAAVIITIFTVITRVQVGYWKNSEVLMTHAIEVTQNNYIAHNSLGNALTKQGYSEEAYAHFMEAAQINPHYAPVQNNIGNILYHLGRYEESIEYYFNALRIDPNDAEAHNNLGVALMSMGRLDEAESHLIEAVRIRPYYTSARFNLALILFDKGNMIMAAEQLKYALRYKPNLYQAHYLLGKIAFNEGRYGEAIKHFQDTLRLKPDFDAANNDIRNALAMQGKKQ
jgi:tetratricopeptide (TPR) repeat protein